MSCNPGRPECFLGQCGFCPGTDAMKQRLIFELEEKGLKTVTYKQWTSTDRCDLITIQNDLDEYCDILCAKLKILGPHDFIAKTAVPVPTEPKRTVGRRPRHYA